MDEVSVIVVDIMVDPYYFCSLFYIGVSKKLLQRIRFPDLAKRAEIVLW